MSKEAVNGELNPARGYAILGMVILCSSLCIFFYQFAKTFVTDKKWRNLIIIGGVISMISGTLMFSKYHDLMATISCISGVVVMLGTIKVIYNSELSQYKITGGICIILSLINIIIYFTTYSIDWLPIIQKLTFGIVLSWIIGLNYQIRKRIKTGYNNR